MITEIRTQVPGNIWKVLVKPGDQVSTNTTLFIMEVMKTEVPHTAGTDGTVAAVHVAEGQEGLDADTLAVTIESSSSSAGTGAGLAGRALRSTTTA